MKLAWLTDIHRNFLSEEERTSFYEKVKSRDSDAVLICGHIHHESYNQKMDNVLVKTGQAKYYEPIVQEIIEIK